MASITRIYIVGTGDPLTEKKIVNLTFFAMLPNGFIFDRATQQSLVDLRQVRLASATR